jgi:hypothetical protein
MEYRSQARPVASPRGGFIDRGRIVPPAEAVQARLFEDLLRAEIAEMLNLPPAARDEMRARIEEVDQLIRALRARFPRGPNDATPPAHGLHSVTDRAPRALLR